MIREWWDSLMFADGAVAGICSWAITLLAVAMLIAAVAWIVDSMTGEWKAWRPATVTDKDYTPSRTGVGPAVTGGGSGVAVTTTSEAWITMLRFDDGSHYPFNSKSTYSRVSIGDRVWFREKVGCLGGVVDTELSYTEPVIHA